MRDRNMHDLRYNHFFYIVALPDHVQLYFRLSYAVYQLIHSIIDTMALYPSECSRHHRLSCRYLYEVSQIQYRSLSCSSNIVKTGEIHLMLLISCPENHRLHWALHIHVNVTQKCHPHTRSKISTKMTLNG